MGGELKGWEQGGNEKDGYKCKRKSLKVYMSGRKWKDGNQRRQNGEGKLIMKGLIE